MAKRSREMLVMIVSVGALLAARAVGGVTVGGEDPASAVRTAGVTGGLIVHAGCRDAQWTARLRLHDGFLVQGLATDEAVVRQGAAKLRAKGLLGAVSVVRWDGAAEGKLPYAEQTVNLLIVTHPTVKEAEIRRVLVPRGVALVMTGDKTKRIVAPWPDDIDEWTHFLHGPDNNAVAADTRVGPPRHLRWVCAPRWSRSHDHLASIVAAVTARGRLFSIVDEGSVASVYAPSKWRLVARDAFSGVLLWKKALDPWEDQRRPFRSGPAELPRRLVAEGDRVYVTLGYGKGVVALDAATGTLVRSYEGTTNAHEIVLAGGKLHVVVSEPLAAKSPTTGDIVRKMPVWRGAYLEYVTKYQAKHIRVLDAATGKTLWQKTDADAKQILPLTLTVDDGRVIFENTTHLVALAADTGKPLWRAERPITLHRYAWSAPTVVVVDGVVLSADRAADKPVDTSGGEANQLQFRVSANHILHPGEMIAFSAKTGERLWSAPCHEGFNFPPDVFVIGGKVYSPRLAWKRNPGLTEIYDLHTGKVVETRTPDEKKYTFGFGHARCYRNKATVKYLVNGRSGVELVDVAEDKITADHWVRGTCQYGILPANGLIYAPSHSCACYITAKLSGYNALAAERAPAKPDSGLREKGPAFGKSPDSSNPKSEDWPTYRHDPARSGLASTAVPTALKQAWQAELAGPLTSVTVAGGRLFVAQREAHTLHAIDAASGAPQWSFAAGGRIDSPPTIWGGRAYFGSADGWLYCLRAADGEMVWRCRIAPESRQIVSYEQLESVWPVHGSPVVAGGGKEGPNPPLVFAVAGRSSYVDGGLYLVGAHAITGEAVVQRGLSHLDPETGKEDQSTIKGVRMPGAVPDVPSWDGESLFIRHTRLDLSGHPQPETVPHLFSSVGYLDDSWWHRTYWQNGTSMGTGYGGWTSVGNRSVSGRLLVIGGERIYGFGRTGYTVTGSHLGGQGQYQLFAADTKPVKAPPRKPAKGAKPKGKRRPPAAKTKYHWQKEVPFLVRAMVLTESANTPKTGRTLFVAGCDRVDDFHAAKPEAPVRLWAVAAASGEKLAEYKLPAAPVLDSLIAARGKLYLTTADGRILCYAGESK